MFILLQCHEDISRPKKTKKNPSKSAIGVLKILVAHNFSKLTQLKPYISMYKPVFICLSETYLNFSVPDSLLEIDGYNLVRADHSNDTKKVEFVFTIRSLFLLES